MASLCVAFVLPLSQFICYLDINLCHIYWSSRTCGHIAYTYLTQTMINGRPSHLSSCDRSSLPTLLRIQ